ncbi:hypothetical protein [Riemerella anatipestifer]|uniref:hypothetical protein n=1 Tax=Riemerella anatipestifer TaxID=34085 RepID=UPI00129D2816|nr:hypothetical protein [Riemerella anatipestifer]MBT0551722.1 hypothetical protein [Riemerella anatipestifer]MBT0553189.1 hypothetical protein [Riemerella anatipestifer]MCE3023883.1 hypothetical protein [Riemerella anatipestifer]MCU7541678.1 hypothetical protein [Riemerella anatipestifer]MCU7559464.1 hypothetical protein [Riemerella anatipestifer]
MDSKKIKLFYLLPIGIVTLYTFFLLYKFENIPDTIPIYGYGDKAKFGKKILIWLPVALNYLILIFIGVLIKNPNKLNLPIEINNKEKVQIILIIVSTIISIFFCLLFVDIF